MKDPIKFIIKLLSLGCCALMIYSATLPQSTKKMISKLKSVQSFEPEPEPEPELDPTVTTTTKTTTTTTTTTTTPITSTTTDLRRRNLKKIHKVQPNRPIMHTFYASTKTGTGMSKRDDRHILELWQESWNAAGWDTRIFTLEDAQKHADYSKYNKDLEDNVVDDYNKMCFLRWLAMAATEDGGWMSDFDVFPIPTSLFLKQGGKPLPFDGRLAVYEYTREGGVPSLISGSAAEWDRMAALILEKSYSDTISSDMFALMNIRQNDRTTFTLVDKVIKGYLPMRQLEGVTKRTCMTFQGDMAIHMSHFAITEGKKSGKLPPDTGASARAQVAMDFVKEWNNVCGPR